VWITVLAKKAAKAGNPCGLARTNPYVEPFVLKLPKPRSKQWQCPFRNSTPSSPFCFATTSPAFPPSLLISPSPTGDGHRVVYCFLRDDGNGKLDEEFDPTHYVWAEWHDEFVAWLADPRFSARAELIGWMNDAPPFDAGAW
jgi:hypothetical protein